MACAETAFTEMRAAAATPEGFGRVFGDNVLATLPVASLVVLYQIRDGANPIQDELVDSIRINGLDNPPNVAICNDSEARAYVDFTNRAWGSTVTMDDLEDYRQPDSGLFHIAIAGLSRAIALRQIEAEDSALLGHPAGNAVVCKIEQDNSVAALVNKQRLENIHSRPSEERHAMAVVETYHFGLMSGEWTSPDEFRQAYGGRIGKKMIEDALHFADLPSPIRSLVFSGFVPYKVGIELGRAAPVIAQSYACEAGLGPYDPLDDDLRAAVEYKLRAEATLIANHIAARSWNVTAAKRYIKSMAGRMTTSIQETWGTGDEAGSHEAPPVLFTMVSAAQQAAQIRRRQKSDLLRRMSEAVTRPVSRSADLVTIMGQGLHDEAGFDAVVADAAGACEQLVTHARRQKRKATEKLLPATA